MAAPLLRHRTLRLARPAEAERLAALLGEGIVALEPVSDGRRLRLTYDLDRVTLAQVVQRLEAAGLAPRSGLLARWWLAWAGFQDDNRRDQSRIEHQCCNRPPGGS
ncbi:hypothetical protein A6A04_05085 [Paramagnetospirillum marisnigri]|uniref:Cation transporter n=1 Tax=Paramagnetospirillum marisnigri TaxID=1285242 RepID=A0A178MHE2_9PROT|nr:hypothetical protein [Paramagnetospirillum marisnigri]OAN48132.1 hypothetical protein A6A04_05085 [Paramagnetospirillum marisnigri]